MKANQSKEVKKKATPSQDFLEKKKLMELDFKFVQLRHKMKMEDYAYCRESDRIHHERELERGRIKSAEIRKTLMRKGY